MDKLSNPTKAVEIIVDFLKRKLEIQYCDIHFRWVTPERMLKNTNERNAIAAVEVDVDISVETEKLTPNHIAIDLLNWRDWGRDYIVMGIEALAVVILHELTHCIAVYEIDEKKPAKEVKRQVAIREAVAAGFTAPLWNSWRNEFWKYYVMVTGVDYAR